MVCKKENMTRKPLGTYLKLCTEFYELEHHLNGAEALAFYMHHASKASGRILEPMCGSGRFLIPMLEAGFEAEGFDASPYMLDALQKKYSSFNGNKAPVSQQFVADFKSDNRYCLIFIPYGSWGLITDRNESKKSLEVLYAHLEFGGKFIVEIETVESVPHPCGVMRRGTHARGDGSIIALNFIASYHATTQLFQSLCRYELIRDSAVQAYEDEVFEQYLYRVDEFDQLLNDVGFTQIKKYPAFDCSCTVKNDTSVIIYECIK